MENTKWKIYRVFCDWHMPECLPEIRLDEKYLVDKIVEMGGQSLNFMCKSAHGNCLYNSEVGFPNKVMKGEIFKKVCDYAKREGLEFIAYYNQTLNNKLAEAHSEWMQIDVSGNPLISWGYKTFCMNCNPFREQVFAHMQEITRKFDIDGFFLDINYFHSKGCFCKWCRNKFFTMFGYELDISKFNKIKYWLDFYTFQRQSRKDFIIESMDRCRQIKPELMFTWNHSGKLIDSHIELDVNATYLGCEGHPPAYSYCSASAKWMASSDKQFEFLIPESLGSWGDWTITTESTLKGIGAIAMAHGGAITINHVAPPCGDYAGKAVQPVYELMSSTFKWVKKREKYCIGKQTVPVVAILHSVDNVRLGESFNRLVNENADDTSTFAEESVLKNVKSSKSRAIGITNSFISALLLRVLHIPTDFIYHERALEHINEYEAIMLPNTGFVNQDLADKLREYVANGGKLIATYTTSFLNKYGEDKKNFDLADLFGVDFKRFSDYSVIYIDEFEKVLGKDLPKMPILIKDAGYQENSPHHAMYCRLKKGAKAIAYFTEPILESNWEKGFHIYHDHSPPGKRTKWPAIIINKFGKGESVFLPFPILQSYAKKGDIWLKKIIGNIFENSGVSSKINIEAGPAIEIVLRQDAKGWLLHLVNIQKENDSILLDESAPSGEILCCIKPPWEVNKIEYAINKKAIIYSNKNNKISFKIPNVAIHEIIRINKK